MINNFDTSLPIVGEEVILNGNFKVENGWNVLYVDSDYFTNTSLITAH